jgi:glutamate N-acetyltransferase/amino-acid N-acetyltransferase
LSQQLKYKEISGGVTTPQGFLAAGVTAEIRKNGRRDVAFLYSETPAVAAAVYTQNQVKAAPVMVTQEHLAQGLAQAVVVNSGIANACTGEQGLADARMMAKLAGDALNIPAEHVAVASTGVIGEYLPMEKIESGIKEAVSLLSTEGGAAAAEAILTTDTVTKEYAVQFNLGGREVIVGGMAKGSGMIHPNMATMLAFITTDACVEQQVLKLALRWAVDRSFNNITVDGDTSTNDMVVLLANGQAGNPDFSADQPEFTLFREAIYAVCVELAKMIARDGEGASKFLEVQVKNAASEEEARIIARFIAASSLVKTAIFGEDANWGRVLSAAGASGVLFDPNLVDVYLGDLLVAAEGRGLTFDEERASAILRERNVTITVDLHQGNSLGIAWGCDLTFDYIKINADYRNDMAVSKKIMGQLADTYRKIRNTFRFLLGNLYDFDPEKDSLAYEELSHLDQWILFRLHQLIQRVNKAYEKSEFHIVYHAISTFCVVDLSSFYLDITKDTLYCSGALDRERRGIQTVLFEAGSVLVRLLAPVMPFTTEEVWGYLPGAKVMAESVHLTSLPQVNRDYLNPELERLWERLLALRDEVAKALEAARQEKVIGPATQANVSLYPENEEALKFLQQVEGELPALFIVSGVKVHEVWEVAPQGALKPENGLSLQIAVAPASGGKCTRCWLYKETVGQSASHPELCERCREVVENCEG